MSEKTALTAKRQSRFDKCHAALVAAGFTAEQLAEWLRTRGVDFIFFLADFVETFGPMVFSKAPDCPADHRCCCIDALKHINAAQICCAEHCIDCDREKCDHHACCHATLEHLLKAALVVSNHKHCC